MRAVGLWCTTPRGFEKVLRDDLRKVFQGLVQSEEVELGTGNVVYLLKNTYEEFEAAGETFVSQVAARVNRLRCAEKVHIRLLAREDERFAGDTESALHLVEESVASIPKASWDLALRCRRLFHHDECEDKSVKFYVTKKRSGKHKFTSTELGKAGFQGLNRGAPGWEGVLQNADVEIFVSIQDALLQVGFPLVDKPLWHTTMLQYERQTVSTPLKAVFAYCLSALSKPQDGDIFVDPMAGSGTIVEVAAKELDKRVFCIGGDEDEVSVNKMLQNAQASSMSGWIDVVQWDVRNLPLRTGCVDRLVTDMPFGKRCGSKKVNASLYKEAVEQFVRVIEPSKSARAVLLSADLAGLTKVLKYKELRYSFVLHRQAVVNIGGLNGKFLVWSKAQPNESSNDNDPSNNIDQTQTD